uniref:Ig-like domain-containing protein n=1 Tax=Dicentrarchus labrax TaxID=13489 RepID=A0A8C4DFM7_DICLA
MIETFTPSAVVTEGQRVTLTCSTSCPLTDNTNYIWYLNSRPLTLPENQNKHLVLDPVSSQHAGRYSCAVKTHNNISSREKTLTVHSKTGKWTPAAAAGVGAVLLVIIPLTVFWWIRTETSHHNMEQVKKRTGTILLH